MNALTSWKRGRRRDRKSTRLQPRAAHHRSGRRFLRLEALEDRTLLSQVSWINAGGGDWDTPGNWSSRAVPGAGDDVVINSLNAGAVVTHSLNNTDTVSSITAAAPITLSGGTLSVAGAFSDSSTVSLSGGTLANATVQAATLLNVSGPSTLQNVTLVGTLNVGWTVTVAGSSLTLSGGTINVSGGYLNFSGTQTLGGTGTVNFSNSGHLQETGSSGTLTIGAGVTLDSPGNGRGTISSSTASLDNQGIIDSNSSGNGDGLTLSGNWSNDGTLESTGATDSELTLSGTWTNNADGQIVDTASTIDMSGTWNNAGMLTSTGTATSYSTVMLGGDFTLANLGTYQRDPHGFDTFDIGDGNDYGSPAAPSTLDLAGDTLDNSFGPGPWALYEGAIEGGTVNTTLNVVTGVGCSGTLQNVTLEGTLNDTWQVNVAGSSLTLASGTINVSGAHLNFSGTQTLGGTGTVNFSNSGHLQDTGSSGTLTIGAGVTLDSPGNGRGTISSGTASLDNQGIINSNSSGNGNGLTLSGTWSNDGTLESTGAADSELTLSGTWTNNADGQIVDTASTVNFSGTWTNAGILTSSGAATVGLGGNFTLANLGTYTRDPGGEDSYDIEGTLTLGGQALDTLDNRAGPGPWVIDGGTIVGGTVDTTLNTDGGPGSTPTLEGVTLAGTLNVYDWDVSVAGAGLTLADGTINLGGRHLDFSGTQTLGVSPGDSGTVIMTSTSGGIQVTSSTGLLTTSPGITISGEGTISSGAANLDNQGIIDSNSGAGLAITGNWSNDATLEATDGGLLTLSGTWTNNGTIDVANNSSADVVGTVSTASLGTIINTGTINLEGTLNNAGATLAYTTPSGTWTITGAIDGGTVALNSLLLYLGSDGVLNDVTLDLVSSCYLERGTISGGTVTGTGNAELVGTAMGGTLSGVALAGTLLMASPLLPPRDAGQVTVNGGLTMAGGSIDFGESADLTFQGNQSLSGTGTVTFNNETGSNGIAVASGSTLTISSGVTVQGNSGVVGSSSGLITNQGTIDATGGGSLTVQGYTNFASGALTGGTWGAVGGSTLLLTGAAITTSAASILLDGASSQIDSDTSGTSALAGFTTNAAAGSFTIQNGARFTSGQAFTNAGTVTINSGGTFIPGGTGVYTQTGGTTILSSGTLGTAGNQIEIQGGTLSGPGTVNANVTNAGEVDLGSSPGLLAVTGNYTQTSAGTLALKVGGAAAGTLFDQVNVTGTAALDGTLNVSLINGFGPSAGESFDVLNFASSSGSFATFNSPLIGGLPELSTSTMPASLDLVGATTSPDLAVSDINFTPANALLGQNVTVTYTDTNLGTQATTAGNWTDSVYLSPETVVDANAVLLGRVTHTGNLAGLASYTGTLTAPLPGTMVGSYHVIVVVDSGLQVPDTNRANNVAVAATSLAVSAPLLTLGTPVTGTIASGQDLYYQLNLAEAADVRITGSYALAGEASLYVRYGAIPDSSHYDEAVTDPSTASPAITLAQPQGGAYYILIQGQPGAGSGQSFTLSAIVSPFAITSVGPVQGSNAGQVTLTVMGAEFTSQTVVQLNGPGGTVAASTVQFQNDTTLYATFDLTGLTPGSYNVQAVDHGNQVVTAPSTFQVVTGKPGQLQTSIATYGYIRPNQTGTAVTVYYANIGDADIPAPLLTVEATNAVLGYADQPGFVGSSITVLGIDQNGPAGILPPGYHGNITLNYQPTTQAAHTEIDFNLFLPAAASTPINWSSFEAAADPNYIPSGGWNAIWSNFTAAAGSTVGQYQAYLDSLATYYSEIGTPTSDVNTLYGFAIELADASLPVTAAIASIDASVATPGKQLDFVRVYQQGIAEHYQMGPLGRGWVDDWQISATTDSQGNVTLDEQGVLLYFALQANGIYQDGPGNDYILTVVSGTYQVRGADGTVIAFNPDGTLHYLEDANQNRITAGYTNGQLTSLTDSNGAFLTLAYNDQGLISSVTDSNGQVTTYTYDPTKELLLSVSNPEETQQYSYITNSIPAQEYALAAIAQTDGTHTYLAYDAEGRLINQQGCLCPSNPVEHLTFSYGPGAAVTTADNTGDATTQWLNPFGEPALMRNALGQTIHNYFDANGHLIRTIGPDGAVYTYTYDALGNLLSETDGLGDTTTFTYNANNNLTSYTDPNGNTTDYGYNSTSNLVSVTYANAAAEQFTYNPLGEATQLVNPNGNSIGYTYNADGLITQETFADGTSFSYTYDKYGNLTSATDALGNVTTFVYGGAHDGDSTNPDLLSEVIYPDGTYLNFFYNTGGQRVQSVDQTGFTINYSYDDAGRLSELTEANGNMIVQYMYDSDGRLMQKDNGNGTRTTYSYDAVGNVLSITNYAPDGVTINSFDVYTYGVLDNVLTDTNQDGEWIYTYDADSQLLRAVFTPNSTDPDGLASQNIQYVYDAAGNRISATINGVTTTYAVNNVNQYTSATTNSVTTSYQYDADGNLVVQSNSSGTTDYTYNILNQLTAVNGPGLVASDAYDALGNLVSQTVNGSTTSYQVDPFGDVVAAFNAGALTTHFTYGLGLTSQVSASGAAGYYDFNNIASTIGITGANGQYVNQYVYLPSGETKTLAAGLPNVFAFLGQWGVMSGQNGLDLMHARNYVASLGRFLNRDPIGVAGGIDLYTYASNDPVTQVDPSGLDDPLPPWINKIVLCPVLPFFTVPFPAPPPPGFPGPTPPGSPAPTPGSSGPSPPGDPGPVPGFQGGDPPIIPAGAPAPFAPGLNFTFHFDGPPDGPCGPPPGPPGPASPPIPPPPGPTPGPGGGHAGAGILTPTDPNDIVGPSGYGPQGFLSPTQTMPYRIDFENEAAATAPAQVVLVTQQLDANLDWSTFELGDFNIGGQTYAVPAGLTSYSTRINLRSTFGVYVNVSAQFDESTGELTWTFTSFDPATLDIPVGDPEEGFLPPDVTPPEGDAWVSYSVEPNATDTTGTVINAQATVYFNAGLPDQSSLATAPSFNTIDAGPPASSVSALPATESSAVFPVSWSGQDDTGGSGIASYDIYVSDNGGAYTLWESDSTQTSATFSGINGHTYGFYSVATDFVGNVQPTPTAAQATTRVVVPVDEPPVASLADPAAGSTAIDWKLDVRKYIDVTYTSPTGQGIDLSSVLDTGPEFTLSGAGAGSVVVDGSPTWLGGNSFRYSFSGMFANGPVNLNFIAGSFTDVKGVANQAATESFNVVVQPSLWIDTPQPVVDRNGSSLVFTVQLTAPITQAVTVSYATANGTAFANKNYKSTKGTLTFGPGKPLVQTIKVPVLDDRKYGGNVSFVVNLALKTGSIPIAQGSATGTILDGDPMPKLSIGNVTVHQGPSGTSKATFTVTLKGATTEVTTVDYATADGTATVANHDYQAAAGILSFSPGVTKETITVLVNADPTYEPPETFQVRLSNPTGATLSSAAGTATIINTSPKQKAKSQNVVILRGAHRIIPMTQTRTGGDLVDAAIHSLMEGEKGHPQRPLGVRPCYSLLRRPS